MDSAHFENVLYPFQDAVLSVADRVETGFYLTGGTALGEFTFATGTRKASTSS